MEMEIEWKNYDVTVANYIENQLYIKLNIT